MGLSQADVANVSMCLSVIHDFWINTNPDSVSRRPVPGRPRATTPAEDRFQLFRHEGEEPLLCRSSLQTTFKHQEEIATTVRNRRQQCRSVCKKTTFPSSDDSEGTAYAGQENMFLGAATMGF
ncbi:hypothetical protein TNCV_490011 [Trichonephila clavipes]|nr:hypothetical protein TNCV_490011 [Trichonephila clavipes]